MKNWKWHTNIKICIAHTEIQLSFKNLDPMVRLQLLYPTALKKIKSTEREREKEQYLTGSRSRSEGRLKREWMEDFCEFERPVFRVCHSNCSRLSSFCSDFTPISLWRCSDSVRSSAIIFRFHLSKLHPVIYIEFGAVEKFTWNWLLCFRKD